MGWEADVDQAWERGLKPSEEVIQGLRSMAPFSSRLLDNSMLPLEIVRTGKQTAEVRWTGRPHIVYQLFRSRRIPGHFETLGDAVIGSGELVAREQELNADTQAFFRLRLGD